MIKNRNIPVQLKGFEAAISRLDLNSMHYSKIQKKIHNIKAGYAGETIFDNAIERFTYDFPFYIFHDLMLEAEVRFQLDSLFVTQFFAVIFDVKNLAGELNFRESHLIKREGDSLTPMENPFDQLIFNHDQLKIWLNKRSLSLPIYTALVLPYPKIINHEKGPRGKILLPKGITPYLRRIKREHQWLDENRFHYLGFELLNCNHSYNPFPILKKEYIPLSELKTGIVCTRCKNLGMERVKRGWRCQKCGYFDMHAHVEAIKEYAMLVGNRITHSELAWFIDFNDQRVINRILNTSTLHKIGQGRYRKYIIAPQYW